MLIKPGEIRWMRAESQSVPPLWRDGLAWALVGIGAAIQAYVFCEIARKTGSPVGAPLDDTYIHLVFARNILRGEGMVFNLGEPVAGLTSPGWALLLAAVAVREAWLVAAASLASVFFYLASSVAAYRLGRALGISPAAAFFAGLMTLLCDRLIWSGASGMETSAFAFAMLIAVRLHIADREHGRPGALSGLCFGIAANLRPEGLLLYAVAWADHCMAYKAQSRQFHFTLRPYRRAGAWASVALFVALVAPYMIFCWRVNGHLFANTYYVKRTEAYTVPPAVYFSILLETLRIMNLRWLFLFLVPGMLAQMVAAYRAEWGEAWPRLSRARILWLWPVLYVSISCFTNPTNLPQMSRYIAPLFPLAALLSVFGLAAAAAVWDVARKRLDRSWIPNGREMAWAAAIASALSAAAQLPHWARLTAQCVDDINRQQVAIGRWAAEAIPPGAVIATHDVGAIPYFSERRIIDTFGLVTTDVMRIVAGTPEIVLQDAPEILAYLIEKRPDYAIGYPSWFGAAARHTECFEPIFETQLEQKSPICGGELMIVWKIDWDKYDPKVEERRYSYGYGYGYGNP